MRYRFYPVKWRGEGLRNPRRSWREGFPEMPTKIGAQRFTKPGRNSSRPWPGAIRRTTSVSVNALRRCRLRSLGPDASCCALTSGIIITFDRPCLLSEQLVYLENPRSSSVLFASKKIRVRTLGHRLKIIVQPWSNGNRAGGRKLEGERAQCHVTRDFCSDGNSSWAIKLIKVGFLVCS